MLKNMLVEDRRANMLIVIAYIENIVLLSLSAIVLMLYPSFWMILIPLVVINWNFVTRIRSKKQVVFSSLLGLYKQSIFYF